LYTPLSLCGQGQRISLVGPTAESRGWSWPDVLAAYKALENTPTGDDALHGRSGPFPIRQRIGQ